MKKDIFLVDADDTVLDFHGASSLALQNAFVACGLGWKDTYADEFKTFNDGLWQRLERKEITRKELVNTRFPLFLKYLGLPSVGDTFNGHYLKYLAENPMFVRGAECFLNELRKLGRVFIVTNGTDWIQTSRFTRSGLFSMCEEAFISDRIGFDKPAKGYTDYVVSHIENFEKDRAVWIGDSLSADIQAANDANIESIWFNPKNKEWKGKAIPTHTAVSFEEILTILQKSGE